MTPPAIRPPRTDVDAYYVPLPDGSYEPTIHVQGAWRDDEQHVAPVSGLMGHHLATFNGRDDLQIARVTFEILGMIPLAPTSVRCRTIRPGRTIELDEAVASVDGRDVVRATAWRLSRQDTTAVAGGFPDPLPAPETLPPWDGTALWDGGYIASLDFRKDPDSTPGAGRTWLRTDKALVTGVDAGPVAPFIGLVDTANGIATRAHPREWMFPNVDLTIHLFRVPQAGWIGFDTEVVFGETGVGLTSSWLHDSRGPVGRVEQILTVRELPIP